MQSLDGWRILACLLVLAPSLQAAAPILVVNDSGHTAAVNRVCFVPRDRTLVSVSNDKTIRQWDLTSGECLRVLRPPIGPGPAGILNALAVSPNGELLAVGGYEFNGENHGVFLIRLRDGETMQVLRGHKNVILDLQFSPDGRWLVSGSADKTARIWDVQAQRSKGVLRGHQAGVYGVAFSPDARHVATASLDKTARIWSMEKQQTTVEMTGHVEGVQCVAWSPDGRMIATGCTDRSVNLWGADGKLKRRFESLGNHVTSVSFTANSGELFATLGGPGDKDAGILIDLTTSRPRTQFLSHQNTVTHGRLSPDGRMAATCDANGVICVWRTSDASLMFRMAGRGATPWNTAWSDGGESILWGNTSRYVSPSNRGPLERMFHVGDFEFVPSLTPPFRTAQTSNSAIGLVVAEDGKGVQVKRFQQVLTTLKLSNSLDAVRCFSLTDPRQAVIGSDFALALYDTQSAAVTRRFVGHTGAVWAVASAEERRMIVTASEDQTLCVWSLDRSEPLVTFFFADREWIAWTPDGFFAASAGGERLMGWQLNRGENRLAEFLPAEKFHKTLYRPDVLKQRLKTGRVEKVDIPVKVAETGGAITVAGPAAVVEAVLPPEVVMMSPSTNAKLDNAKLTVKAAASSKTAPLRSMRLLLNGRPHEGRAGERLFREASQLMAEASWDIELAPGRHQISVQAESTVSKATSATVEVAYVGGSVPDTLELPNLYVLAVGVSAYPANELKLNYAAGDALAIDKAFRERSRSLFRKIETTVLTDAQATQRDILRGLSSFRRQMTQRDVGVIFFAGHGEKDEQGIFHLLPVDVDPADIVATSVSEEQLRSTIQGTPGRVVLMLDACHAGALGGDKRRSGSSLTDDLIRDLLTDDYGTIVMCSSMGREFSMENNELRQGNFTAAVTEGLAGKADVNSDGTVYLNELDYFVTERVKELSKGRQHPVTQKPASIRSFPLSQP